MAPTGIEYETLTKIESIFHWTLGAKQLDMQKANGDTFQNHLWGFLKTFFETNAKGCKLNMLYSKRICVPGGQPIVYAAQNVCIASCIHDFSGVCIVYAHVCVVFLCMRLY